MANLRAADAVAVSADDRAEEGMLAEVAVERIEAEHDVTERPALVGDLDRRDDGAPRRDGDRVAFRVGQRVEIHGFTAGALPQAFFSTPADSADPANAIAMNGTSIVVSRIGVRSIDELLGRYFIRKSRGDQVAPALRIIR
jgi:hypothetical protein